MTAAAHTPDVPCDRCARPVPDRYPICHQCAAKLAAELWRFADRAAPALIDAIARLDRHPTRASAAAPTQDRHPDDAIHRDRPDMVNWDAADRARSVTTTITIWCRRLADTTGLPLPVPARPAGPTCSGRYGCRHESCRAIWERDPGPGLAVAARWLAQHARQLRRHPAATAAAADLDTAVDAAWRLLDGPRPLAYYGPCGAAAVCRLCAPPPPPPGPAGTPGTTGAHRPTQAAECVCHVYGPPEATHVRCRGCGTAHDAAQARAWMLDAAGDQLLTAAELATALSALLPRPVTSAMVRGWAHRGRLAAHGHRGGWPTYRLDDARALAERTITVVAP